MLGAGAPCAAIRRRVQPTWPATRDKTFGHHCCVSEGVLVLWWWWWCRRCVYPYLITGCCGHAKGHANGHVDKLVQELDHTCSAQTLRGDLHHLDVWDHIGLLNEMQLWDHDCHHHNLHLRDLHNRDIGRYAQAASPFTISPELCLRDRNDFLNELQLWEHECLLHTCT